VSRAAYDVLGYLELEFLPKHGKTLVNGELMPASSTARVHISGLEKAFSDLGRTGPWSNETRTGNPCNSVDIGDWRIAYGRDLEDAGVEAGKPLSFASAYLTATYCSGLVTRLGAGCDLRA
jgi:hypothetical protein